MSDKDPFEKMGSMFKELYDPKFVPKDIDLNTFYNISEKEAKEDIDAIYSSVGFQHRRLAKKCQRDHWRRSLIKTSNKRRSKSSRGKKEYSLRKQTELRVG